jgi:hypothetical protein
MRGYHFLLWAILFSNSQTKVQQDGSEFCDRLTTEESLECQVVDDVGNPWKMKFLVNFPAYLGT